MNKTDLLVHIRDLNAHINLDKEAQLIIENIIDEIFANETYIDITTDIVNHFRNTYCIQQDRVEELASDMGIEVYRFWLAFDEILSFVTKDFYKNRRIPEEVFYDSMSDIKIWTDLYHRTYGEWALEEHDWIRTTLSLQVIRLGRLEFELVNMGNEKFVPFTIGGVTVKNNSRLINIHIPEGDSITKEKRMDSYKKAYKFFNQTGLAVFTCDSWLIFGKHDEFLDAGSNILDFTHEFVLKEDIELTSDLWRIFGKNWEEKTGNDYTKLPEDTKIQKAYKKRLLSNGSVGISIGFFVFDGENIISKD